MTYYSELRGDQNESSFKLGIDILTGRDGSITIDVSMTPEEAGLSISMKNLTLREAVLVTEALSEITGITIGSEMKKALIDHLAMINATRTKIHEVLL